MADPATDAAYGAEKASTVFPPFDPTYFTSSLFWVLVWFAVLYFIMAKVALPKVATVIEERKDAIADDLDQAAELKRQTDEAITSYEKSLADAKAKAQAIAGDMRAKLDAEIAEMQAKMDADLAAKTEAAEKRIAETRDAALANVREIAVDAASDIVEALTGQSADAAGAVDTVLANRSA